MISSKNTDVLTIEAGKRDKSYWRDILGYKDLFFVLAFKDISVRYKQTVIGVLWAVLQPFLTMVVFTVIFGKLANMPSEGNAPYALMVFAGLLPWQLFSLSLSSASQSLVGNTNLISKVYFPRIIIPATTIIVTFVDFLIGLVILILLMLWFSFSPSLSILSLPFFIIMAFAASFGPGLLIASLNVKYRDFRYVVPFIISMGLYLSPVGFSSSIVPEAWRLLYSLNPMVGVIEGFRWALLGGKTDIYMPGFALSWAVIIIFIYFGVRQFRKMEKTFADVI